MWMDAFLPKIRPFVCLVVLAACAFAEPLAGSEPDQGPRLYPRNTEVPFCYVHGGSRGWPIIDGVLPAGDEIQLVARQKDRVLAAGKVLEFRGIRVSVTRAGQLTVESKPAAETISFDLHVQLSGRSDGIESQTLEVRPAPPRRPISYVADLVDDLIHIFRDPKTAQLQPLAKDGLDQYFRRLQAHGVARLVVWQSPFPYMSDPDEFTAEDWQRYESQARAIIDNKELAEAMRSTGKLRSWAWLAKMMSLRLTPEFGRMFTESAAQHDIALTASFRPFEHALTKYYEVPAFDADGAYLWGFLPLASPVVNYHPDQVGFANYREVLARMGKRAAGELAVVELAGVERVAELVQRFQDGQHDLKIVASAFPPLDSTSWVLVRAPNKRFRSCRYHEIRAAAGSRLHAVTGFTLTTDKFSTLRIADVSMPDDCHFLTIRAASDFAESLAFPADPHVTLRARAGNRIGRANIYWALDESEPGGRLTRVGGILEDGGYRAEFQATENSIAQLIQRKSDQLPLRRNQLVINLGRPWSVEMVDFNQAASRKYAVAQMRTMLSHPAFDEILINTRSHAQLAASTGDGVPAGLQTIFHYKNTEHVAAGYRSVGKDYIALGIDRAYAPRQVAAAQQLRDAAGDLESVEQITTWQAGEWQGTCQSADSPFQWRYQRNRAVAQGVRQLLVELEQAFPGVRIRAVIPQRAAVDEALEQALATMKNSQGKVYGANFFRHVWSTNNYMVTIGEGMSIIDLSGLHVEPVFLGIRYAPDDGPLKLFVDQCLADLADNRGSRFRGPRTFFYEAQETMRGADSKRATKRRQEIIRYLLSQRDDIREVLLYEAADWTSYLPMSDPYGYLDKRPSD